jgi:UMF1 family MFS transporter
MADRGTSRKRFLLVFAAMGILATGGLYFVPEGEWLAALIVYVIALSGFSGSIVFYDALLVGVSRDENVDKVSSLGYSLGYLGGGLLFAVNVWMLLSPATFGLADATEAVKVSFVTVAVWWAVFSLPLFRWVPEPRVQNPVGFLESIPAGFRQLGATFREVRKLRYVVWFLLGYWLYIDGVDTVMKMAVIYGQSLGLDSQDLLLALLITQFVGFPSAIAFGIIGQRMGTKTGILMGLGVYLGVTVWGYFLSATWEFYALAVVVGLVQGGVQALSRSFYSRIIPKSKSAEFFGFYNMLGKFAAVIGPLLMGWIGVLTGSSRLGILSIAVLFVSGGILLALVDESRGRAAAAELDRL